MLRKPQAQGTVSFVRDLALREMTATFWTLDMEQVSLDRHLFSPSNLGFVRAAVISPELRVADVAFNTQAIIAALREAAGQGCRLAVFPELSTHRLLVRGSVLPAHAAGRRRPRRWTRSRSRRRRSRSPSSSGCRWRWTASCSIARRSSPTGGCWASSPKPTCLPPTSSTRSAGSRRAAWRFGRRSRSTGARRRSAAICFLPPTICRTA